MFSKPKEDTVNLLSSDHDGGVGCVDSDSDDNSEVILYETSHM